MCFRSATRTTVATVLLAAMLGGCSEYYFDRRDTITLYSGDAVATNRVTQMIDPWPVASGRHNIAYSGEKAATASERYRIGRVIPPINATTSSAAYVGAQQAAPLPVTNQPSSPPNNANNSSSSQTK